MKATVILENDSYAIEIDARDRRAFERDARSYIPTLPSGNLRDVASAMPETYVGWLAWHACRREELTRLSWPEFEAQLLDIEEVSGGADELPDPTRPTPTGG